MNSEININWNIASIRKGNETLSVLFPAEVQATEQQSYEPVQSNGEE